MKIRYNEIISNFIFCWESFPGGGNFAADTQKRLLSLAQVCGLWQLVFGLICWNDMIILLKTKDLSLKTGIVFGLLHSSSACLPYRLRVRRLRGLCQVQFYLWLVIIRLFHIQAAKSTSCVGETFRGRFAITLRTQPVRRRRKTFRRKKTRVGWRGSVMRL